MEYRGRYNDRGSGNYRSRNERPYDGRDGDYQERYKRRYDGKGEDYQGKFKRSYDGPDGIHQAGYDRRYIVRDGNNRGEYDGQNEGYRVQNTRPHDRNEGYHQRQDTERCYRHNEDHQREGTGRYHRRNEGYQREDPRRYDVPGKDYQGNERFRTNCSENGLDDVPSRSGMQPKKESNPVETFINLVINQPMGSLIMILGEDEHPYVALANSLQILSNDFSLECIKKPDSSEFVLYLNKEKLVKGIFPSQKEAKIGLGWLAINKFHQTHFTILKKSAKYIHVPDSVSKTQRRALNTKESKEDSADASTSGVASTFQEQNQSKEAPEASADVGSMAGSIAHKMMMKMGWTGRGLGVQEQGITERVEVSENIDRMGLGHSDVSTEIKRLITDYSKSDKITALAFSKDFTKGERELIHKFCMKFKNLKTKSIGKGDERYITVSRKINNLDIVRILLRAGCENEHYKLIIPEDYTSSYEKMFPDCTVDSK